VGGTFAVPFGAAVSLFFSPGFWRSVAIDECTPSSFTIHVVLGRKSVKKTKSFCGLACILDKNTPRIKHQPASSPPMRPPKRAALTWRLFCFVLSVVHPLLPTVQSACIRKTPAKKGFDTKRKKWVCQCSTAWQRCRMLKLNEKSTL
jgi:hypothetical protein